MNPREQFHATFSSLHNLCLLRIEQIAGEKPPRDQGKAGVKIRIPQVSEFLQPIVPLQLLPYLMVKPRGCDVDKRRNLAKSFDSDQEQLDRPQLPNSVKEITEPENLSSRTGSTAA